MRTRKKAARLDPLIEGYLGYLDKVGRKVPRTIVDVRCTLRRAIAELEKVRPGVELWHLKLEDYLHWLEAERQFGRSESSLAKYLSHVRGLLDYAWRSGRTERNVLDGFNLQHHQRRDRLIILLLYGCGLRTNELCALDVAHVNRERHELLVLTAKGDRPHAVPIPEAIYTELLAYLLERGKRGPLFRTKKHKRRLRVNDGMTRQAITNRRIHCWVHAPYMRMTGIRQESGPTGLSKPAGQIVLIPGWTPILMETISPTPLTGPTLTAMRKRQKPVTTAARVQAQIHP